MLYDGAGDYVDVLEASGAIYLCRTHAPSPANTEVGYFPQGLLATEEAIYEQFMEEEDQRLAAELEKQKRDKDQAEEAYEKEMREKIKAKIAADKSQRARAAEERKQEAERLQKELEEQRVRDEADAKRYAEERAREVEAKARQMAKEDAGRMEEARRNKAQWSAVEDQRKEDDMMAKLPQWKKDMVMKKRREEAGQDPNLSGVFPGSAPR